MRTQMQHVALLTWKKVKEVKEAEGEESWAPAEDEVLLPPRDPALEWSAWKVVSAQTTNSFKNWLDHHWATRNPLSPQ